MIMNKFVIKVSLKTLDDDGDASNGIYVTSAIKSALNSDIVISAFQKY